MGKSDKWRDIFKSGAGFFIKNNQWLWWDSSIWIKDKPLDSISLCFYGDSTGIKMWNNPNDPMPIKTTNMAGLQKWEETEDYIIYLDKKAVITTVAQYVTGTYDLFLERKADIDGSMELLRANEIEWTAEDDSKLILDINKAQLERIANTPTAMEDEDFAPQTFTTRAVPTTYECCFRVDKSSGEIYIGEGYENLVSRMLLEEERILRCGNSFVNYIGWVSYALVSKYDGKLYRFNQLKPTQDVSVGNSYTDSFEIKTSFISSNGMLLCALAGEIGNPLFAKTIQESTIITKTSTPKPFVKSIMPSGKLAFVTGATSKSHSFVIKGVVGGSALEVPFIFHNIGSLGSQETLSYQGSGIELGASWDAFYSEISKKAIKNSNASLEATLTNLGRTDGHVVLHRNHTDPITGVFKQLLIYKGSLSEAELKAENEKDIRLK